MIFRKRQRESTPGVGSARLDALMREYLPEADAETRRIVGAVAGLLACTAYADREYSEVEQLHVREALERVDALSAAGVHAICAMLREHVAEVASSNTQAYTRTLRELADLDLRREVLDLLVDLAAVDDDIAMSETHLLRRTTTALGLSQDDYVASQTRYRDRISVLK